jgi:hypothetical protein
MVGSKNIQLRMQVNERDSFTVIAPIAAACRESPLTLVASRKPDPDRNFIKLSIGMELPDVDLFQITIPSIQWRSFPGRF